MSSRKQLSKLSYVLLNCVSNISCFHAEEVNIPQVREGWHMWWHPYGEAMLPEHVMVVHPSQQPWDKTGTASKPTHEHLDQALIYNWLDQANMYHVLMETGNFIFATACKLLGACTHASSHYQTLATVGMPVYSSNSCVCNEDAMLAHYGSCMGPVQTCCINDKLFFVLLQARTHASGHSWFVMCAEKHMQVHAATGNAFPHDHAGNQLHDQLATSIRILASHPPA